MLYLSLVWLYNLAGHAEAASAARRVSELARSLDDDGLRARAELVHSTALVYQGKSEQAFEAIRSAILLAETANDLDTLFWSLMTLSDSALRCARLSESRASCDRAVEVSERLGDPSKMAYAAWRLGALAFVGGDWKQARVHYEHCGTLLHSLPASSLWQGLDVFSLAELCLAEGGWEGAAPYVEALLASDRTARFGQLFLAQHDLAQHDLLRANPLSARNRLTLLLDLPARDRHVMFIHPVLARALLESGDDEAAERTLAQGRALAFDCRDVLETLMVQGVASTRRGHWDEAERHFADAVISALRLPYPFAEARTLLEWGMMCDARGEPEQALERLGRARTIFRQLGALPFIERTERAIRSLPSSSDSE
jgi:tetratricopeptide (TPR) repeat protein